MCCLLITIGIYKLQQVYLYTPYTPIPTQFALDVIRLTLYNIL